MEISWETMVAMQFSYGLFMLGTYEHGARDPFWYGMRTVMAVSYSVFMFGDQRAYGTIMDWLCQTLCLCHYISVVANVFNPTMIFRRKDA
jgi:hypothetical protein